MKTIAIIPARMGSSRFPGKPMAKILGIPMIERVYRRVSEASKLEMVIVATCDQEIFDHIEMIGGTAVMTSPKHERASDRCAEALVEIENQTGSRFDVVVMVQGDEPLTKPEMIDEALKPIMERPDIQVVNLRTKINDRREFEDPNCIKVVCDLAGNALYFSRQPIPTSGDSVDAFKQVCIIPFRRDYLLKYATLDPTPLELSESIDMMRVLEHGSKVFLADTEFKTHAVDTVADLKLVELLLSQEVDD